MRSNYDNLDKLMDSIFKMYDLYEQFIWDHNNKDYRIKVLVEDKLFRIMLQAKDDIIDIFQLQFDNGEKELQKYIVLSVFRYSFRDIQIHNNGSVFFNVIHRPYLKYKINDNDILNEVIDVSNKHNEYKNNELDNDLSLKYYKILKNDRLDNNIVDLARYRVSLSKRLVKGDYNG